MNQKTFANIILVAVIVILVGVVGYFVFVKKSELVSQQPTPDKTANWKTYTNTSLGFSIKYPPEWKIDTQRSDRTKSGSDVVFSIGIPESHEGVRVDVSNLSLDDLANQADKNNVVDGIYDLTIDGQTAIHFDTTEFGEKLIGVKFNGKLYVFSTDGRMIENGMLSTVKFIK